MIAQGKANFDTVVTHVLKIFRQKFDYFKLSIGVMEKLLIVMKATNSHNANADFLLTNKVHLKDESKLNFVNFCIKCFSGHMCVQYHNKKGWGIKCDTCNFRIACLTGAGSVRVEPK